ncbi:MAG: O-antigen ligase family protein [Clostridia bacterium]|nr:O-antigen ligase family protein [Clostridia bacterium]
MLLNNNFIIKKYVIISFIILSIYFLLNTLIYRESRLIILPIYIEFIFKGFSAFIIGSLDVDGTQLYSAFLKTAFVNFIAIGMLPFINFLDSANYMRFGYAMVPSVIMFIYAILNKEKMKIVWIIIATISLILTVIYGSRGPLVVIFLCGLLLFLFSKRISKIKKINILGFSCIIIFLVNKYNLFVKLIDNIYYTMGIQTYALAKLLMMFNIGFIEASSGRGRIYSILWDHIKQNPVMGHGIGFSHKILGCTPHNIFLQILLEFGIIGLLVWMIVLTYCLYKYKKIYSKREERLFIIITLIASIALGRLLISSDMWLRPEYWLALSMLFNFKYKHKYLQKV